MHPCRYPCCPNLLKRSGYCDTHKAKARDAKAQRDAQYRASDPSLQIAHQIRSSRKWQQLRRQILMANPICADPFGDHARRNTTESSKQVHHIKGLRNHPELWNHADNLQCLCYKCHSKTEQQLRQRIKNGEEEEVDAKHTGTTGGEASIGGYF